MTSLKLSSSSSFLPTLHAHIHCHATIAHAAAAVAASGSDKCVNVQQAAAADTALPMSARYKPPAAIVRPSLVLGLRIANRRACNVGLSRTKSLAAY